MIKIGGKEVAFSAALLLHEGEVAEFDFLAGPRRVDARITFSYEGTDTASTVDITLSNGVLSFDFKNWRHSLGAALKVPTSVAKVSDGIEIFLQASVWLIGETYKADVIFLIERGE